MLNVEGLKIPVHVSSLQHIKFFKEINILILQYYSRLFYVFDIKINILFGIR